MSLFKQRVIHIVKNIPKGNVASYGQVALIAGTPKGARQVGWVLNSLENHLLESNEPIPWWRVINNKGFLSIRGTKYHDKNLQKKILLNEGVGVNKDYVLDIEKYRWRPNTSFLKQAELEDEYIQKFIEKYLY
ncbi:MGMT family protein [Patescibacteria group bacterium]